jgi:hypothetical protein
VAVDPSVRQRYGRCGGREFLTQRHLEDGLVGWSLGATVSWEAVDQFDTDRIRAPVDVDVDVDVGSSARSNRGFGNACMQSNYRANL